MNQEETMYQPNNGLDEQTQQKKVLNTGWKRVTIGGIAGIMVGAAATYAATQYNENNAPEANENQTPEQTPAEHPHATNVTDEMSFEEAFAAARAEVGTSGTFTWHGHVYGTFTADEWNAMSNEDKMNYFNEINEHAPIEHQTTPEPQVVHVYHHNANNGAAEASSHAQVQTQPQAQQDTHQGHTTPIADNNMGEDSDVHALGDVQAVENADGSVTYVQPIEAQGHMGLLMGDDASGPDVAVIDINDTNSLDPNDIIIDLNSGDTARIGDVMAAANTQPDPGYTNADYEPVSEFDQPTMDGPNLGLMEDPSMGAMDDSIDMATDVDVRSI